MSQLFLFVNLSKINLILFKSSVDFHCHHLVSCLSTDDLDIVMNLTVFFLFGQLVFVKMPRNRWETCPLFSVPYLKYKCICNRHNFDGGGADSAPPYNSMKEGTETHCYYLEVGPLSKWSLHAKIWVPISK